jgi:hypothetical protein
MAFRLNYEEGRNPIMKSNLAGILLVFIIFSETAIAQSEYPSDYARGDEPPAPKYVTDRSGNH